MFLTYAEDLQSAIRESIHPQLKLMSPEISECRVVVIYINSLHKNIVDTCTDQQRRYVLLNRKCKSTIWKIGCIYTPDF